jgi:hypothetical protein
MEGTFYVFIDDKIFGVYDEIGSYYLDGQMFSPSGEHFACIAKQDGHWYLFYDDKKFGPYSNPRNIYYTENEQITYCATENGVDGFYINGKKKSTECPTRYSSTILSDDKGNFAFTAEKDSSCFLVYNDQKFGPYSWCSVGRFFMNSNVLQFYARSHKENGSQKIIYNDKIYISSIVYDSDLMLYNRENCIGVVYYDPVVKMIRFISAVNPVSKP